jgi:O-antigen ligase
VDRSLVIIVAIFGVALALFVLMRPMIGLLLIISINQFDSLVEMPTVVVTPGRIIGIVVAIGWLFSYLQKKGSNITLLNGFNILPVLLVFSIISSTLMSPFPKESLLGGLTLIFLIFMFFLIQDFIANEKLLKLFIVVVAFSAGTASIIGILQYEGFMGAEEVIGTVTNYSGGARFAGFRNNPNGYGAILMSGIPFLLFMTINGRNKILKILSAIFLMTSVTSLYLTMSRTHVFGFIAFLGAFLFLSFKKGQITFRKFLLTAVIIFSFTVIYLNMSGFVQGRIVRDTFSGEDTSVSDRADIFYKGLHVLMKHPIFGVGFGAFKWEYIDGYSQVAGEDGHDVVSGFFASTGLFGIIVFIFFCIKTFRHLSVANRFFSLTQRNYLINLSITLKSAFIALLLSGSGNTLVFERIFWIYIALAAVLCRWAIIGSKQLKNIPQKASSLS